jgi:outer membrane receptor protein involved in Fe transport
LFSGKYSLSANYFNNLFRNRIDFSFNPVTFYSQYVNVNKAMAHGAEVEFNGQPTRRIRLQSTYVYTSTQILQAPLQYDPLLSAGAQLLRRPRHAGNLLVSYVGDRFGGSLGGTFIGRRVDSDFLGLVPPITHTAGYARVDLGTWYNIRPRVTAYANIENLLNRKYEDVAGYPALRANFRAGLRFRLGGD